MAVCKGDIGDGEDIGKRNSAYSGCRLFWSGESSSQVSVAQSSGNVLHFHLHLLSYSNSSCGGSQNPNTSDLSVQSLQKVEAVSEHVEIDSPIQCEEMVRVSNLKEDVCQPVEIEGAGQLEEMIQVSNFREAATKPVEIDGARQREERVKVPKLEEAEIDHAVELSIAASEALVINELVESDSALRYLPMIAVVEMALRIKQARLEDLKNPPHGTIGGTGKDRPPVELDNISEMDAFKDVGVSSSDHDDPGICDLDVSCVEETPISKNHVNYKNGSECVLGNIGNLCTSNQAHDVLAQDRRLRKGSSVEVASKNAQNQDGISIGLPLGPGISDTPNHVDKNLHLSVGSIPNGSAVDERSGSVGVGGPLYQPQSDVNLSPQDQEQDRQRYTTGRFRSHWFGGWTAEEVDAAVPSKQYGNRSIAKPFVGETSFLSESADVAVDENSVVQERKHYSIDIASQSNIPLGGSCEKRNQGLPFSQEAARSLSPSSVDPLCSVVPCSLSMEDSVPVQAECQDDEDNDAETCGSPASGPQLVKLCKTSDPEIQCNHQKDHSPTTDEECSKSIVQRRLSSLKNYSMLLPSRMAWLENRELNSSLLSPRECNRRIAAVEIQTDTNRPSGRIRVGLFSHTCTPTFPMIQHNEKHHGSDTSKPSDEEATVRKSLDEFTGVAQIRPPLPAKRQLPLILNPLKRRRIQLSRYLANDSFSKEKHSVEPEPAVNIHWGNIFNKMQLQGYCPTADQAPQEKRVRFAEDKMARPVDRSTHKFKSPHRNCSTTQSRKRLRYCNQQLNPRTKCVHFFSRCSRDRKNFIFQGMEFLVTGFSSRKEKEMEWLIQRHGGIILSDIPSNFRRKRSFKLQSQQPTVIASKKLRTAKFLYGCAIKCLILDASWLTDSISAGSIESPEKYMIISYQTDVTTFKNTGKTFPVFEGVGIMLHGKRSFYTKFATIIKHGGGQAFKTLQQLLEGLDTKKFTIGTIVTEFESATSRHLRHCAMERNVPVMPASWIVESLYAGKLFPLPSENYT
ncbi:uncharacterized protein LOC116192229 isoform X2 [Punica granatum]|uniref:Uncharacterized protein LOC116192229 isoform X2 n=1 Tax=Punica granatum TaxID=22663 RepID=A0A6P8C1V3_PUNGR|nr:uncharacterized protein LOC116192229 isoform X2 [Punica granatum]